MMKKLVVAGTAAAAILSFTVAASAAEFYATPVNSGPPMNLPGQTFPPVGAAIAVVNGVTQPVLQPLLAPGGAPAEAPGPMMRHHHHHRHMARMMKHKMS